MKTVTESPIWKELKSHQKRMTDVHMRDLFMDDPHRFAQFSRSIPGLFLDFSKNRITHETLQLLTQLAQEQQLEPAIDSLFKNKSSLHTAFRAPLAQLNRDIDNEVIALISQSRAAMRELSEKLHQGLLTGYSGKIINQVIHIGIGGSHLGPELCYEALSPLANQCIQNRFITSYDPLYLARTLASIDFERSIILVVSKSFVSAETLTIVEKMKEKMIENSGDWNKASQQFYAITQNQAAAEGWGILPGHILPIWEWVVGRFSIWSAVGLSLLFAIGMENFLEFLAGAQAMDLHFRQKDFLHNLPIMLAVLAIWYGNFFNAQTQAIIPYSQLLRLLPNYLQQLHMESLGKKVTKEGREIDYATGTIIWGGVATASQHSFHQLLLQGKQLVPIDFILALEYPGYSWRDNIGLIGNCLAQSQTLMQGYSISEIKAQQESTPPHLLSHKVIDGNSPSNTLILEKLSPYHLGALLALYEHKVFVQSVIWGINSFDQWGVERGKKMAKHLINNLEHASIATQLDNSTQGLMQFILSRE